MEQDLHKLGLMQLRIYARSIGVRAPTAFTKDNLIEKIEEIKNGLVQPYFSGRGRPLLNDFTKIEKTLNDKEVPLTNLEIENLELRKKVLELNEINIRLEKTFYEFKKLLIEIIKKF